MGTVVKPTIGRVMWFYKFVTGGGHKGPMAALVAYVHSDSIVNLAVADEDGKMRNETSVQVVQEGQDVPTNNYATWMPYQIGQAAKTEAAEAALKKEGLV